MDDPKYIMWKPVKRSDIAWNFEKFLITPAGNPFQRFVPQLEFYIKENGKGL
jgi:glutathione peroxidase